MNTNMTGFKNDKPWYMGTHLRVLSKGYQMNTNMTGFRWFSKDFVSLCFGQKSPQHWKGFNIYDQFFRLHSGAWSKESVGICCLC